MLEAMPVGEVGSEAAASPEEGPCLSAPPSEPARAAQQTMRLCQQPAVPFSPSSFIKHSVSTSWAHSPTLRVRVCTCGGGGAMCV